MNKDLRKLKLNRETLRQLTDASLQEAKGGYEPSGTACSGCASCACHHDSARTCP